MDTSFKVQHTRHFKFDPAKQTIGAITLPEEVIETIVAGEEIINKKVSLDEAFSAEEQEDLRKALEASVLKAHQRASAPVQAPSPVATSAVAAPAAPAVPSFEEEGDSLF